MTLAYRISFSFSIQFLFISFHGIQFIPAVFLMRRENIVTCVSSIFRFYEFNFFFVLLVNKYEGIWTSISVVSLRMARIDKVRYSYETLEINQIFENSKSFFFYFILTSFRNCFQFKNWKFINVVERSNTVIVEKKKMKPLATGQRVLTWLCVCPPDETTSKWRKRAFIIFSVCVFMADLSAFVTSVAYVHRYVSIDLEKSLCSMLQICAMGCVTYAYLQMFVLRHEITALLEHLSQIYKKSKVILKKIFSGKSISISWNELNFRFLFI